MEEKYIMVSLEDEKTKRIAEVLSNKTCKKILDYLIENKNSTQNDISKNLNIPLNTLDYNIKKLLESGLIKKGSNFFWSKNGKKIAVYSI